MLREFTKDIGRYKSGELRDFPQPTWDKMAESAKQDLDKFTKRVNPSAGHQLAVGGPMKVRKRLVS